MMPTAYVGSNARWPVSAKLKVLTDISAGKLSVAAACAKHGLSAGELDEWATAFAAYGERGLMVTHRNLVAKREKRLTRRAMGTVIRWRRNADGRLESRTVFAPNRQGRSAA